MGWFHEQVKKIFQIKPYSKPASATVSSFCVGTFPGEAHCIECNKVLHEVRSEVVYLQPGPVGNYFPVCAECVKRGVSWVFWAYVY